MPVTGTKNSFDARQTLDVGGKTYTYFSLPKAAENGLGDISRLPFSLKVLLENMLRFEDGGTVTAEDVRAFGAWLVDGHFGGPVGPGPAAPSAPVRACSRPTS